MKVALLLSTLALTAASDIVQQLFELHNQERQAHGLAPFVCLDATLSRLSLDHVRYEVSIDDINHDNFDQRCNDAGENMACGENTLYDYDGDARIMTTSWMNSPGHRDNILGDYNHVGFGVEKGPSGKWFATAMFTQDTRGCGASPVVAPTDSPIEDPTNDPVESPTDSPTTPQPADDWRADSFVQQLFQLHNQERQANGLAPFTCLDAQLSALSADHVDYEISIGDINHDGFSERCDQVAGYRACGENTLYDYDGDASIMTQSWMDSPGHRANILGEYNHVGFGVKKASDGKWFATAMFTQNDRPCARSEAPQGTTNAPWNDEPSQEPTDEPYEEPTEEPWEEPTEEPAEEPAADPTDLVRALFDAHNTERTKNNVKPFTCLDTQLSQLSMDHVNYEVSIDDINHDGFSQRCDTVGAAACGENTLYDYVGDATKFTQSWMNSPGHRKNILNGNYNHVGFAVEKGSSGKWFATAMFTADSRACQL